jgi:multiple sugar transport system permease protein
MRSKRARQRYLAALMLSLPALIGLILFQLWPMFEIARFSFYDYNMFTGNSTFKGIQQYITAAHDPMLATSLKVSASYLILKVPIEMALALLLALLVSRPGRGISVLRTIILLPTVTSMVVASVVWGLMYNPDSGLINSILTSIGLQAQPFLTSQTQVLPSIAIITIWKEVGISMLFFLAGLMTIPNEYYDAAKVDGANSAQILRFITVPLLNRTTIFVLITTTISTFKVFVPVKILTEGGPGNASRVIVLYIFDLAFKFSRLGYATAISVILAVILLTISLMQLRFSRESRS